MEMWEGDVTLILRDKMNYMYTDSVSTWNEWADDQLLCFSLKTKKILSHLSAQIFIHLYNKPVVD